LGSGASEATLHALEERLRRAAEAAERLIAEAAGTAAREARTRLADGADGAAEIGSDRGRRTRDGDVDVEALLELVRSVRDRIPPELQRQLAEAVRELLLAVRALIDWYLERTEERRAAQPEVQDIPIL
jgi:hypothetical protein